MNILFFGQLEEVTNTSTITLENVTDTEMLMEKLYIQYPLLKDKKFVVAVNKKIASAKIVLNENDEIALLPPFSGG